MYFALFTLYAMSQDTRRQLLWPGVLAALLGWMVLSALYSLYVERIASYSLLYGSVGTAVVLLMWLYLTAVMWIMGAELNGVLMAMECEQTDLSGESNKQAAKGRRKG